MAQIFLGSLGPSLNHSHPQPKEGQGVAGRNHVEPSGGREVPWTFTPSSAPYPAGHCVDLPDTGHCSESIPRWYYNPFTDHCARFTYGGCYGNKNNFEEEEQCLESCRGISSEWGRGGLEDGEVKGLAGAFSSVPRRGLVMLSSEQLN